MKKIKLILILMSIFLFNTSLVYAHTKGLYFYEVFDNHVSIMIIILLAASFIAAKNYNKLKAKNKEISNFNELKETFIDASHNTIFLKDENLKYVFVNKAFEKFNNKESSEIIGYDDFDFLDEDLATMYNKTDLDVLDKKTVIIDEVKCENKVYRTTKFPVKLLNDHYGIGAYIEDATEEYNKKIKLEQMNVMLNKSNNLLYAILESSPEIIVFALDKDYCYLSFNSRHKETMNQIWGKDIEIGMSMLEVIGSHDDYIKVKENFDRVLLGESFNLIEDYGDEKLSRLTWQNHYSPIYTSYDNIIGLTCFVLNITDRIKAEEEIAYLSYHDSLTGLYNRRFFEEELTRLDVERNLPISVIVGDVNGLKLTNDIFGHAAGDQLLQKVAEVFKRACRADDIIARVGGDEFTILLPKTREEEAKEIISRVKNQFSKERVKAIKGSISMGCDTKRFVSDDMLQILKNAENSMYSVKTLERENVNATTISTIIETLHKSSPKEVDHSKNVSMICQNIGRAMNLPEVDIRKAKEAGFLHDIGKIILSEDTLNKNESLTEQEQKEMNQHPITGYRILNSFDNTLELAGPILAHHEKWDGSGYPKGLKGEEIPKLARIIAVAENYDSMTSRLGINSMSSKEAINEIRKQAGIKFDPDIVNVFIKMILHSKHY